MKQDFVVIVSCVLKSFYPAEETSTEHSTNCFIHKSLYFNVV